MLDYSSYPRSRSVRDPFEPANWVGNAFCRLEDLDLFSVPVSAPSLFDSLQIVEISDFSCAAAFDPFIFPALFRRN
jgi:hypothetical protein